MSSIDPKNEFLQKMQLLKNEYLKHIPTELGEIEKLSQKLLSFPEKNKIVVELHQRLHKITGSAGTFGLIQLSDLARPIENQLKELEANSSKDIEASVLEHILNSIVDLKKHVSENGQNVEADMQESLQQDTKKSSLIWLVEDDQLLGPELARQIQSFGYEVRLFHEIQELRSALTTQVPDLMILDVFFDEEGVNATEVLQLLPALTLKDCALIFMSAIDDFDSRIRAAQLGAKGFFIKPLDVPSLINRAAQIFDKKNAPPMRVLVIDDDELLAQHHCLALKAAGVDAETLVEPSKIMQTLAIFRPELILMDLYMPTYSGHDLAGVIRQHDNWASTPIIYLSSETDVDKQINAMECGGDDFLTKPISNSQLVGAVRVRVNRFRQLDAQIKRDSLTGLLKHSSIKESVANELSRSERSKSALSVAMIDIDNFKMINDVYGHATGDLVICSIAMLLKQRLRGHDFIGRYGGEEFLVALPECNCQQAFEIMEDIRERFSKIRFCHATTSFYSSVSIGIACNVQFSPCTANQLLMSSDKALYTAKNSGRNLVKIWEEGEN